eukprot:231024_1
MSSQSQAYNIALFVPCIIVLILTLMSLITSSRNMDYNTHWKILTLLFYMIHSGSVALYFAILPLNYINKSCDLNILSIKTFSPFVISYNVWGVISISMCLLQMFRCEMILPHSYNYGIFAVLLLLFLALWMMLYIWVTQYFVPYFVSWWIIMLYLYLSYLLYYKPIRLCLDKSSALLNHNHHRPKPCIDVLDMLSATECDALISGWITMHTNRVFIPADISKLCRKFIYVGDRKTDHDVFVTFHGHNVSLHLKHTIETNARMIFVFVGIGISEFICVILYCMKIIVYQHSEMYLCVCEIGLYIFLFVDILCNNHLRARKRSFYTAVCVPCKYYMDQYVMKYTAPPGYVLMDEGS